MTKMFDSKFLFQSDCVWNFPCKEKYPQSQFGAERKYDIHTGVDIFVPNGTRVLSLDDGVVVNVEWFTGELSNPPTPWWNNTKAVWILHTNNLVVVYGEIETNLTIGTTIMKKSVVGEVIPVLKKEKTNQATMLHLEMYDTIPENTAIWKLGEEKPKGLLNPRLYLSRPDQQSQ